MGSKLVNTCMRYYKDRRNYCNSLTSDLRIDGRLAIRQAIIGDIGVLLRWYCNTGGTKMVRLQCDALIRLGCNPAGGRQLGAGIAIPVSSRKSIRPGSEAPRRLHSP